MNKIIAAVLLLTTVAVQAQHNGNDFSDDGMAAKADSLRRLYGKNKTLPADYALQALTALSYYPELRDEPIRFVIKKAKLPYASRPQTWTLLTPFVRKKYIVVISDQSIDLREKTLLKNMTFSAQTGALGHELAHTLYYSKSSKAKIMLTAVKYLFPSFKEKFEKMTDLIAIEHGLGLQIYEWNKHVYPVKILDGKRAKIYYSPDEILEILKRREEE